MNFALFAVKHLTAAVNQRVSAVHIELPSAPIPSYAPPPTLDRPPISDAADRVGVLMRRTWVGNWCVWTVASDVGDCCRWRVWLLKYNANIILSHIGNRVHRAFLHFSVISVPSVACIKILSRPPILHSPALPFLHSTDRPSLALRAGCGCSCAERGSGSGVCGRWPRMLVIAVGDGHGC